MSDDGDREIGGDTAALPRSDDAGSLGPPELQRLDVLQRVGIHAVWGLLEHCPLIVLRPGDILIKAGQANQTMYFVLEGRLSVRIGTVEESVVGTVKAGQTVGELCMLDDRPAPATIVAEEHCRLLALDETTFWRLIESSHEFATNLLLLLSDRLRSTPSAIAGTIRQRRQFEHESRIDNLTGLHNRRWLDEMLPRLVERHRRDGRPLCVAMVDIDEFKKYNDTYGHEAGDRVLVVLARVIAHNLRPTDLAARYGGEEFAIVFPNVDIAGAGVALERLRLAVAHTPVRLAAGGELPPVSVSAGLVQLAESFDSLALLGAADAALLTAKRCGRNRIAKAPTRT